MMDTISLNPDKDHVLIDLSYYIFYRYYAILNWLRKFKNETVEIDKILENDVFMEKYAKMFEKQMVEIVKCSKVEWNNVFLIKDCPREDIWRHTIFQEYKATRDDKLETFNGEIFKYTYNTLIPKLQEKYSFSVTGHSKLEADDVVYLIKEYLRKYNPKVTVTIITNDNDYIQLVDSCTIVKNLQGKELKTRVTLSPENYLEMKIIMGDKSDNIPCINKKVGPKTAEKLAEDKDNLSKFCLKHPAAKLQYELNKKLIDFKEIPEELINEFIKRLEIKDPST